MAEIRGCTVCAAHLPLGPRPVLRPSAEARVLIVGQAPGTRVHATGIPWNDPSGERLRQWLGIGREQFYGDPRIAIVPMGFCYPGKGARGDNPPRPECAPLWHAKLLAQMPRVRLKLLVGRHAQSWYLGRRRRGTLAATVQAWREFLPADAPLPHPSPRNILWFRRHAWFEADVVPAVRGAFWAALEG